MHLVPCQHHLSAPGGGGGGGGILQMRVKIKTPKIPFGYHQNPRKILGSKINPPPPKKKSLVKFPSLKISRKQNKCGCFYSQNYTAGIRKNYHEFSDCVSQRNTCQTSLPKKIPESKISNSPKYNLSIIPIT